MTTLRYPDFFCIGAQKAGTTWLHHALAAHPDLWLPPLKEVHYFDVLHMNFTRDPETGLTSIDKHRVDKAMRQIESMSRRKHASVEKLKAIHLLSLIGMRGLTDDWYGSIFGLAPRDATCGEITPEYALLPLKGIEHMLRLSPEARFIFMLRDPIERGWSDIRMVRARPNAKDVSDVQRAKTRDFFQRADYLATIEKFRTAVGPDRFQILYFDHILEDPRALLQTVCAFLGVPFERADLSGLEEPVHQGEQSELPPDVYDTMKTSLKPVYERLRTLDNPVVEGWYRRHFG